MLNTRNFGIVHGEVMNKPRLYTNQDGSKKVLMKVAAENNYENKKSGKRDKQFIPLEGYIPYSISSIIAPMYETLQPKDIVTISYTVKTPQYTNKKNQTVNGLILHIETLQIEQRANMDDTTIEPPITMELPPETEPSVQTDTYDFPDIPEITLDF